MVVLKTRVLSESKTASEMRFMPASEGETGLMPVIEGALREAGALKVWSSNVKMKSGKVIVTSTAWLLFCTSFAFSQETEINAKRRVSRKAENECLIINYF